MMWSVWADSCVAASSHREGVTLSVEEGILCVLGNYNGSAGNGRKGNWMRIGVEELEGTNSRGLQKMAGVDGH